MTKPQTLSANVPNINQTIFLKLAFPHVLLVQPLPLVTNASPVFLALIDKYPQISVCAKTDFMTMVLSYAHVINAYSTHQ